ncbi:histidine kinase dimerization/phospho-acceptor domain-containing protein, partial [Streptomyces violascens]|uniref:histidine kinase dimerization/phospho-acceptor domain-containing protein n=1 Tax=Streptomyces violascens TaxID=67381 RepID=UPI0036BE107C
MLSRLPVRIRTALLAGLVALLLCSAGAWWLRAHLYAAQYASTVDKARVQARTVAHDLVIRTVSAHVPTDLDWPYVVVTPAGRIGTGGGGAGALGIPQRDVPPAPDGVGNDWSATVSVHTGAALPGQGEPPSAASLRLAHRTLTAVGAAVTTGPGDRTMFDAGQKHGPLTYTVYALVLPEAAQAAADQLNGPLLAGVPLIALLVAATAYASTRRALRPVEAIRGELAEISEHQLTRRVPVPPARDEIRRLAVTTNETLDRLELSTAQQRRFVADAAHELRSPLTALQTRLQIALAHPDRADWPGTTSASLAATRRLHALTEDLLFLTRPHAHQPPPALVDLAGTAAELTDELRLRHPYGPHFTTRLPASAPVRGNPLQLHRLLRNLLDNAARHARTTVTVTVDRSGGATRLTTPCSVPSASPGED